MRAINGLIDSERLLVDVFNVVTFRILGVDTIQEIVIYFVFYTFLWSSMVVLVSYLILKEVDSAGIAVSTTIISLPLIIGYTLPAMAFLSETPSLLMFLLTIYLWVRYAKRRIVILLPLSALTAATAAYTRQPYLILIAGGSVLFTYLALKRRIPLRHYLVFIIPALIFLRVPLDSVHISKSLFEYSSNYILTEVLQAGLQTPVDPIRPVFEGIPGPVSDGLSEQSLLPPALGALDIFLRGLLLGWGPFLFFVAVLGILIMFRRSSSHHLTEMFLQAAALLSLLSFAGTAVWASANSYYYTLPGAATLLRLSNSTVPACLIFLHRLYSSLTRRRLFIVLVLAVISVVVLVPVYQVVAQKSLSYGNVDRFSFSYRAPYVLAREEIVKKGGTEHAFVVAWVSGPWEIYLSGLPNVKLMNVYTNRSEFEAHDPTRIYVLVGSNPYYRGYPNDTLQLLSPVVHYIYRGETLPFTLKLEDVLFESDEGYLTSVKVKHYIPST